MIIIDYPESPDWVEYKITQLACDDDDDDDGDDDGDTDDELQIKVIQVYRANFSSSLISSSYSSC